MFNWCLLRLSLTQSDMKDIVDDRTFDTCHTGIHIHLDPVLFH